MTQIETQGGPEGPGDMPGTRALEASERQAKADEARSKVASWWPRNLERTDPELTAVSFTRGAVATWGPSTPEMATRALAACHHFCFWLLELGHDLDPETSFSDGFIETYMAGPMAKALTSSRRDTLYYLRQLNPARTGARLATISVARAARAAGHLLSGEELPTGDIAEVIGTYVPKNVDPVRFGRVAELVRSAVAAWGPKTSTKAVNVLCWCTYLATWADPNDRPLRADVVFHPDTVEDYVAMRLRAGADPKSMATEAAALRLISRTICPTLLSRKRVEIAKPDPETPYGAAEIDSLLASSAAAKTRIRRRYSRALTPLGLAVGPFGGDYTNVQPAQVRRVGAHLVVTLLGIESGRTRDVVALPQYSDLLESAAKAATAAGATPPPSRTPTHRTSSTLSW